MSRSLGTLRLQVELPEIPTGTNYSDTNAQTTCVLVASSLMVHNATKTSVCIKRFPVKDFAAHLSWWFNKCCDRMRHQTCIKRSPCSTNHLLSYFIQATVLIASDKASCYPSAVSPCNYGNTCYHLGLAVVTLVIITATIVWDLLHFLILAWYEQRQIGADAEWAHAAGVALHWEHD